MSGVVLRDYQESAIEAARAELRRGVKRLIVSAPTGAGKCLSPETPVVMADGGVKFVDGSPQRRCADGRRKAVAVTGFVTGYGPMGYSAESGSPREVHWDHVLTLSTNHGTDLGADRHPGVG